MLQPPDNALALARGSGSGGLGASEGSLGVSGSLFGGAGGSILDAGGAPRPPKPELWSGGILSDIGDALSIPQQLMMEALTHKPLTIHGERLAPSDWLNEHAWGAGTPGALRFAGNLAADVVVDPLNLLAAPVKAAEAGGKALTLGGASLRGLGELYKAVGASRPLTELAVKVAANPIIQYVEKMGVSLTRFSRAARQSEVGIQREAVRIMDSVEHSYDLFRREHPLTEEMDKWVSRVTDAGWDLQHDWAQELLATGKAPSPLRELQAGVGARRRELLGSEEFLRSPLVAEFGGDPARAAKEVLRAAAPFWAEDRRLSGLLAGAGVFGPPGELADQVASAWGSGGHLKRIFAFNKRPELMQQYLKAIPEEDIAYFADTLRSQAELDMEARKAERIAREAQVYRGGRPEAAPFDPLMREMSPPAPDDPFEAIPGSRLTENLKNLDNSEYWRAEAVRTIQEMGSEKIAKWRAEAADAATAGVPAGALPNVYEDRLKLSPFELRILHTIDSATKRGAFQATEAARTLGGMHFYDQMVEAGLLHSKAAEAIGAGVLPERLAKVPMEASFGAAAGRFGDAAIVADVMNWTRPMPEAVRLVQPGVTAWKRAATTLNPATHVSNWMGNVMLAHLAGDLPPWKLGDYWEAAREVARGDGEYLRRFPGEILSSFTKGELPRRADWGRETLEALQGTPSMKRLYKAVGRILSPATDRLEGAYDKSEALFKLAVFIGAQKRGMGVREAGDLAQKALFNYREVPRVLDVLRKSGLAPFVTFPYKALPVIAQAAAEAPQRVALYARKIPANLEKMDPEAETKRRSDNPPTFIRNGAYVRLAGPAGQGRYAKYSRALPWSAVEEAAPDAQRGVLGAVAHAALGMVGPAPRFAIEQATGQTFYGAPVAREGLVNNVLDAALPGLAPGGRWSRELARSLSGDAAAKYTPGEALAAALGGVNIYDTHQRQVRKTTLQQLRNAGVR